jgi:hypothetical protein
VAIVWSSGTLQVHSQWEEGEKGYGSLGVNSSRNRNLTSMLKGSDGKYVQGCVCVCVCVCVCFRARLI